ncbi:hypothetical protein C2845_PM07G20300 [Panicum miliaceum]|uniref:Uncharacterized protein n=1 Tax=Panicum miliaceum TaxID=4540 RepID=A0A3L6SNS6_PANMI|nr:hypothetical protein C2845_PM07G20300 [Panicum miliaceum]
MAFVIAEKLDVVRKMVSSACGVPLPVDMKDDSKMVIPFFDVPVFPEEGVEASAQLPFSFVSDAMNLVKLRRNVLTSRVILASWWMQQAVFAMLDNLYSTVKRDIDAMISASHQ